MNKTLTQALLKSALYYDPDTGAFKWLGGRSAGKIAGGIALFKNSGPYRRIMILRRYFLAHRLAVLYMTGDFPRDDVDHIDGDGTNNRWHNLRIATASQNAGNSKRHRNNKTGFKGVCPISDRFQAHIRFNGRKIHLGTFATPEAAHEAYRRAARKHFGEFARFE